MAYKTGRSRALSLNGTVAGRLTGAWSNFYLDDPMVESRNDHGVMLNWLGCGINMRGYGDYDTIHGSDDFEPGPDAAWKLEVNGPTMGHQANASIPVPYTTAPYTPSPYYVVYTSDYDITTDFSITVEADEWMEFDSSVPPTSNGDDQYGIVQCPPRAHLKIYEVIPAGSTITITATHRGTGTTLTVTDTTTADQTVDYRVDYNYVTFGYYLTSTLTVSVSASLTPYTGYYSSGSAHGHVTVGSGSVTLTATGNATSASVYGNHAGATTGANGTMFPVKAFTMTGALKSVTDSYPGGVDITMPKWNADPLPTVTRSDGWSDSYALREFYLQAGVTIGAYSIHNGSVASSEWSDTHNLDEQTVFRLAPALSAPWCQAHDEFVTYQATAEGGGGAPVDRYVYPPVYMHGWTFPGLRLTQPASFAVDPCTSATGWTGATLSGGSLHNTGTGAMTRTFTPFFNFSGYRYLKLSGMSVDSGTQTFVLSLGGKTWTRFKATTTPTDILIDLLDPDTGGAAYDAKDTAWPDANPTLAPYGGAVDGPLWGVTYATTLTLSGFATGRTYTFSGISLARRTMASVDMLSDWSPRFSPDMLGFGPDFTNDSGTTVESRCKRGLVAKSDGLRQALELPDMLVQYTVGGMSGTEFYVPTYYTLSDWQAAVHRGGFILGPSSVSVFAPYQAEPNGWDATVLAPANDSSSNLKNGFLNADSPAHWLMGRGLMYSAPSGVGAWASGVGLDASSGSADMSAQLLFTTLDWYPDAGDAFGYNDSSYGGPIQVACSWITRAQSWGGAVLTSHGPATGRAVRLTAGPDAGALQADGTLVGAASTGSAEGEYRTTGDGLIGYTTAGTAPALSTAGSHGLVSATGQSAAQSFRSARLSRVALRVAPSCCDGLFFKDPDLHDPLPALSGDSDALPVEEWRRGP